MHVLFEFDIAMASVDGFDIFGEEVPMNHGEGVAEVVEVQLAPQPNGAAPRLNWTTVMPALSYPSFQILLLKDSD